MNTILNGNFSEFVSEQARLGDYASHEDLVCEAFHALVREKMDQGIDEGLRDVEEGRVMEINKNNLQSVLSRPVEQW